MSSSTAAGMAVVSSTLTDPGWNNTTVLDSGDATAQVAKLKQEFDGTIQVPGSNRLVHELIESDLVDQVNLMIFPVVLGTGKRVFAETSDKKPMRLKESRRVPMWNGPIECRLFRFDMVAGSARTRDAAGS